MVKKTSNKSIRPILYFGNGRVEWIPSPGQDDCGYRRDETESMSPKDMVRVARGLVRESGAKPGKCTVLIGGTQVKQRTYSLGEIPQRDMRDVLRRKAANLLEVEEHQAIYSAISLANFDGESDNRWLVSAVRLDDLRGLQRQLLADGFRPKRFLFARQAMLKSAEGYLSTGASDEAWVIAGVEDAGVAISLVAGSELVQQSFVPGEFSAHSAMAGSVLQEMRGFESYWRRFSRGGAIDDVFIAGLSYEESERFEVACHAALPESEFLSVGGDEYGSDTDARSAYLITCASGEGVEGDLTLPTPIRPKWVIGTVAATVAIGLYIGSWMSGEIQDRTLRHENFAASLSVKVPDLDVIESDLKVVQSRLDEVAARRRIATLVGTAGLELSEWMYLTELAFENNAALESVHFDDSGTPMSFSATGRVPVDPSISTPNLAAIDKALGGHPELRDFQMRLPATVSGTSSGLPGLEFRVTGSIAGHAGKNKSNGGEDAIAE